MNEPIATRVLSVDGTDERLEVMLWSPEEGADGTWMCRAELRGWPARQPPIIYGVDGLQAIRLAIDIALAHVRLMPEYKQGRLRYSDGSTYTE
jgi:hypothetical protein